MEYKQTQIQLYSKTAQNTELWFSNWLKVEALLAQFKPLGTSRYFRMHRLYLSEDYKRTAYEKTRLCSFICSRFVNLNLEKKKLFPNNCDLKANPTLRTLLRAAEAKLNSKLWHLGGNRCRGNPVVFIPHLVFRNRGKSMEPFCIVFTGVIYYPS